MSDKKLIALCAASDVAPGCTLRAEADGKAYAVYNVEGNFYVTQDECTHGPGYLSEGYILGRRDRVSLPPGPVSHSERPRHLAPATEPIKCWKVSIVDGKVCIDPSEHGSGRMTRDEGGRG